MEYEIRAICGFLGGELIRITTSAKSIVQNIYSMATLSCHAALKTGNPFLLHHGDEPRSRTRGAGLLMRRKFRQSSFLINISSWDQGVCCVSKILSALII